MRGALLRRGGGIGAPGWSKRGALLGRGYQQGRPVEVSGLPCWRKRAPLLTQEGSPVDAKGVPGWRRRAPLLSGGRGALVEWNYDVSPARAKERRRSTANTVAATVMRVVITRVTGTETVPLNRSVPAADCATLTA